MTLIFTKRRLRHKLSLQQRDGFKMLAIVHELNVLLLIDIVRDTLPFIFGNVCGYFVENAGVVVLGEK